jgi:outer membrane receptor protein involved in Fe transport
VDGYINEVADSDHEYVDFTYMNTDAIVTGGELSASYRFNHALTERNTFVVGLGAAHVYGIDLGVDEDDAPLFGIPPFQLSGELTYHGFTDGGWLSSYSLGLLVEYAADQHRIAPISEGSDGGPWGYEPSDAHVVFGLTLGCDANSLPGSPGLRLVAQNLFDTDYYPFGSYIPAMGRNVRGVVSFKL